jgi:hypothetical protein
MKQFVIRLVFAVNQFEMQIFRERLRGEGAILTSDVGGMLISVRRVFASVRVAAYSIEIKGETPARAVRYDSVAFAI